MIYSNQPEGFNPRFEVVSCFCECEGKILLLHRDDASTQGNTWGAPAGKIERNETPLVAIARELKEETSLDIPLSAIKFHSKIYVRYESHDFTYYIFDTKFLTQSDVKIDPKEHKDFRWLTPQEALQLPLVKDMDSCIKYFYKI